MSSFDLLQKGQRYIMILMVPFLVIWLIAMGVLFAIHMPYMLLSYPIAGVAIWICRKATKKPGNEETEHIGAP